ncbi:MAG: beta-ketoacyl-[acyl-carrier-protein] synthase II [Defluviicoccus sp.]|nr:beta-ketoacyl-[acyl-carrier-protein] synthase II [Defluviicoccus sp.]
MRRVVITGLGLVTPLGAGVGHVWARLINGESGIGAVQAFDVSDLPCKIAGTVPLGNGDDGRFDPDTVSSAKDRRKMDDFIVYTLGAAAEAVGDSGWTPEREEDRERTGVLIGSGIGGLKVIFDGSLTMDRRGPRRVTPFFIPASLINLASGQVSIRYGFKGPNHSVVTACATGAHAIGDAARMIMLDDADVMVAGGASRPWDRDRDGFVMGEGAGIVVLEEMEHARRRGARIYGEVVGYGMSGDAHHITSPPEDGNGGYRSMMAALKRARLNTDEIDYINAHGTSTPLGDEIELGAVKRVFGEDAHALSMSSTKSAIGHLLGAAGSVEAIFSIMAVNDGVVPPTLNLDNPSEGCDLDLVPKQARERPVRNALSNSFGFGGTNASLIFAAPP